MLPHDGGQIDLTTATLFRPLCGASRVETTRLEVWTIREQRLNRRQQGIRVVEVRRIELEVGRIGKFAGLLDLHPVQLLLQLADLRAVASGLLA